MAASVESRVPFLDHELVEHVVSLPERFKLHGWTTKAILRRALESHVPREILHRKKMGFPVPFGKWLRGPLRRLIHELVLSNRALDRGLFEPDLLRQLGHEHQAGLRNHGDALWLLINLETWLRIFFEGEEPAAVLRAA